MLTTLAVSGYRSLRDLVISLDRLNLVTGPNGSGKSSLYREVRLLADTAQGQVIPSLAREGGLQSTLWAGPATFSRGMQRGEQPVQGGVRKKPVSLRLGFAGDDFSYAIDLGLPSPPTGAFGHDPEIKREYVWNGPIPRPSAVLVDRRGPLVKAREADGEWTIVTQHLASFDSMMTHCADPRNTPEMLTLREEMRAWRFYDHFRTDATAPARQPQIGTHTPILSHDGHDLAAALQTIREIGDSRAVDEAIDDAFAGGRVTVRANNGWFEVEMEQHGLLRPLKAAELWSVLPTKRPFETSTRSLGIATLRRMPSGSSRHWSLLGHQMLEPSPSQAVLIQCLPVGSLRKAMPPKRPFSSGVPE
jgi:predicted ATPase